MWFIKICIQQTYQILVPQTGGPFANSHLPSQGYQFERKIQGTQIFPFVAFIRLVFFCLPKLAKDAIRASSAMLISISRTLGLSVIYLKKGILAWDTLTLLDIDTSRLSSTPVPSQELPRSISNPVTNSCLSPCSAISHTPAIVSATSLVHKASHFIFRLLLQNNS